MQQRKAVEFTSADMQRPIVCMYLHDVFLVCQWNATIVLSGKSIPTPSRQSLRELHVGIELFWKRERRVSACDVRRRILPATQYARIRCFTFSLAMVITEYFSQQRQLVNRHASCHARVFGKKMIVGKRIETLTNNKLNRVLDRTVSWRNLNRQYGNNPD